MTMMTGTPILVRKENKIDGSKSSTVLGLLPHSLFHSRLKRNTRQSNTPHHTESDTSSTYSLQPDETLYERIVALQDMIPASTRRSVSSKLSTTSSWIKSGLLMGGKTLWVVSTSALLLGVPWALGYGEEQMIIEQERAELMQQRAQNEVRILP